MSILKNIRKIIVGLILIVLVLFVPVVISDGVKYLEKTKVDRVLKTDDYAYLPEEAKEYIKEVYKKTGEVILTEKNKEENKPYLNPLYISYMGISDKEKGEVGSIPSPLIVDYSAIGNTYGNDYDERYDLRDYNLVTPVRDQTPLGLCWTFATSSVLETHLMKKNNLTYDANSTQKFSERQLDYATAIDGIKDYDSEYVSFIERNLGDGGNFYISTIALANGISAVDLGWKIYDGSKDKLELNKVLNYNNSLYEVNSTTNMPTLNVKELTVDNKDEIRTSYINLIKENILENGAAVVSTYYSDACLHTESSLDNVVLDVEDNCVSASDGHAMTVIGWDDSIEYDYCADTKQHTDDIATCTNKVKGQGVWILKNSWGDDYQPYPYLTYDSSHSGFHFINNMTDTTTKVWDNNYVVGSQEVIMGTKSNVISANVVDEEKLELVKLMTYTVDTSVSVKILKADGSYTKNFTVSRELPGLITLDLSDENINVNKDSSIVISSSNGYFVDQISLFTSNTNENYYIDLSGYDKQTIRDSQLRFYSSTRNIPSNSELVYQIIDKDGNDVTSNLEITNNIVAENNINTLISGFNNIESDDYTLKVSYNGTEINLIEFTNIQMSGSGTEEDPYIITDVEQLKAIDKDLTAHYKLGNDIVFGEDEQWVPLGVEEPFMGVLDGDGHSIKGLTIDRYEINNFDYRYYYSGLFSGISGSYDKNTVIKNINFIDSEIQAGYSTDLDYTAGVLAGCVYDCYDSTNCDGYKQVIIDNVKVIGADLWSPFTVGGLVGEVYTSKEKGVSFNNIYLETNLFAFSYVGGLIGIVTPDEDSENPSIEISNVQNIEMGNHSNEEPKSLSEENEIEYNSVNSHLIGLLETNVNISNVLITGDFYEYNDLENSLDMHNDLFGVYIGEVNDENNSVIVNIKNSYYTQDYNTIGDGYSNVSLNNVRKKSIVELTDASLYENWEDFNVYWNHEAQADNIPRIPVLKNNSDFEYTSISDINILLGQKVYLYDLINPDSRIAKNITYEVADNSIISTDHHGDIEAIKAGETVIHVISNYDGYEKDVPVVVTDEGLKYTITFNSNNGENELCKQYIYDDDTTLNDIKFYKTGYHLKEWNTSPNGDGDSYADNQVISNLDVSELELYAIWENNTYTVNYSSNGGNGTMEKQIFTYDVPQKLRKNSFTKSGYKFLGWKSHYHDDLFKDEQEVLNLEDYNGWSFTLYANWLKMNCVINYFKNDGSNQQKSSSPGYIDTRTLNPKEFTRDGYKLVSWNTKSDGSGESYSLNQYFSTLPYTLNEDGTEGSIKLSLYAQWEANSYSVVYDANGGTGSMENDIFTYDKAQELSPNEFINGDLVFIGWNTKADGTGESYSDKAKVTNLTAGESITLYAQWMVTYDVTFDANGGTFKDDKTSIVVNDWIDSKLDSLEKPTRDGYSFKGFFTEKEGGTSLESYIAEAGIDQDNLVFYAQWEEEKPYIIEDYVEDKTSNYIDKVDLLTDLNTYKSKFKLGNNHRLEIDLGNKEYVFTGSKTKIYKGDQLITEFINIVRGEVNGDGKVGYADYVYVYNHIYKTKHPESNKNLLVNEYLIAADISGDNTVGYADYVMIYNKIKELKGGNN